MVIPHTESDAGRPKALVPFIGRRLELDSLTAAIRRRESPLVFEPAGAGKTRLVEEAPARAEEPSRRLKRRGALRGLLVEFAVLLLCRLARFSDPRRAPSLALRSAVVASQVLAAALGNRPHRRHVPAGGAARVSFRPAGGIAAARYRRALLLGVI